jgi:hypothetical protein
MKLSSKARAAVIAVALLVTLSLPLFQHDVFVYASQPSLTDIFSSLGFNNVTELTVETFPAGTYNITLYAKFGGDNNDSIDRNELSFYQVNSSVFNVLYTPSEPTIFGYVIPPLTKTFSASYEFGLSLLSWRDTRYFTEHVLNPEYVKYPEYPDESHHVKVYLNLDDPSMLLVGFDERSFCTTFGDHDFNDMVFSLQQQYYLDVISTFDTPTGQGWYNNGTDAFASLASNSVDLGNGTREFFLQWSNDASGNNYAQSAPIHMNQNKTAVAAWNTQYYLTVKTSPTGLATIPGEDWYDPGTNKTLTALAVEGYTFAYWDVDGTSQGSGTNPITVTVERPHTATAHYLSIYALRIEAGPGGSTNPPVGSYPANEGSTVQVTANPSASYAFDHWLLDGTSVGSTNPYSVLMDGSHTLKALFKPLPPPTVTINPMLTTIFVGQSVNFTSSVSGQTPPYAYQWYMNNNPVSGATISSWTFTPDVAGGYSVYLKVTDINGNTAQSGTAQVTVKPPLSVSISPLESSILPGQTVDFTSTVTGGTPPYTYQWYLGGNPVAGATSSNWTFQPMTSGIFYVHLRVTDALSNTAQSGISRVEVHSVPVGGYTLSFEKHANAKSLTLSFALTIVLATFFVAVKRRTTRKRS